VQDAFFRLVPGDVIVGHGLGRALVCEQPRRGKGKQAGPRVTIMTTDRKLRRVTPKDFRTPPQPVGRMDVKGQSWRAANVRGQLARSLKGVDIERAEQPPSPKEIRELTRAYESHPCHECPEVQEHLSWADQLAEAEAEVTSLRRRVRRRKGTISRTFERVLEVLRALGYVEEWGLTEKGELLAAVYNEADLLVVECLSRGWFQGLDPDELAAVVSMFVYESRGRDVQESAPTPHLSRYQRRITNL
jgi:ATP-dependent RNA helicase HelY